MDSSEIDEQVARARAALDGGGDTLQVGLLVPNGAGAVVKQYAVPLEVLARIDAELAPYQQGTSVWTS